MRICVAMICACGLLVAQDPTTSASAPAMDDATAAEAQALLEAYAAESADITGSATTALLRKIHDPALRQIEIFVMEVEIMHEQGRALDAGRALMKAQEHLEAIPEEDRPWLPAYQRLDQQLGELGRVLFQEFDAALEDEPTDSATAPQSP